MSLVIIARNNSIQSELEHSMQSQKTLVENQNKVLEEKIDVEASLSDSEQEALPTRHNMQIMRRLFHMGNGFLHFA